LRNLKLTINIIIRFDRILTIQKEILNLKERVLLDIEINLIKSDIQKIQNYMANYFFQLQPKIAEIIKTFCRQNYEFTP
jgi:hypothetical protein